MTQSPTGLMLAAMMIAGAMIVAGALFSWVAVRRCPLACAIGLQIKQVSAPRY
jgi:hypothetical protein